MTYIPVRIDASQMTVYFHSFYYKQWDDDWMRSADAKQSNLKTTGCKHANERRKARNTRKSYYLNLRKYQKNKVKKGA